jgi:hypothetical protein
MRASQMCSANLLLIAIAGCACAATAADAAGPVLVGRIASSEVTEASGLARSTLRGDRFWVVNDGGSPPVLHAIGADGRDEGTLRLESASNVDWEDIAAFELEDRHWLLVADTGDNDAIRDTGTIYVVEEPATAAGEEAAASPSWTIPFRWPDGPRDCEAVAVDTAGGRILLLSKRDIPAVLYELPLRPQTGGVITATRLGTLDALPRPTSRDLQRAAPERNWHWQPTAMDIAPDGSAAVILTYRAVYHFEREAKQRWIEALRKPRAAVDLEDLREAEAVAFIEGGTAVIVTVEALSAPLYRVPLLP